MNLQIISFKNVAESKTTYEFYMFIFNPFQVEFTNFLIQKTSEFLFLWFYDT
jgi:hypothetical protein